MASRGNPTIAVRVPKDVYEDLQAEADGADSTVSEVVREVLGKRHQRRTKKGAGTPNANPTSSDR